MSNKITKIILPTAVLSVLGGLIFTSRVASAQAQGYQPDNLIQRLVERFGLKQEEVQTVFTEARQERLAERETLFEQKLAELVTEGKLTEAQKLLILDKHKQLLAERQADLEAWQSLSREERRTQAQQRHEDLLEWASNNGIDSSYLSFLGTAGRGEFGEGMMRGKGMGRMMDDGDAS